MVRTAHYAYTQARLQARHGMRLDASDWHRLEAQQSLANYLHIARQTTARPWVLGLHVTDSIHTMEHLLSTQFRQYITLVANWLPAAWRPAVRWVAVLDDLPAIQHLLHGEEPPVWMAKEQHLSDLAGASQQHVLRAMSSSEYAPLVRSWQQHARLSQGWLEHWMSLWPNDAWAKRPALTKLTALLQQALAVSTDTSIAAHRRSREQLTARLAMMFRQHTEQPAAVFIHLALLALDLERLRGGIARRAIFAEPAGVES